MSSVVLCAGKNIGNDSFTQVQLARRGIYSSDEYRQSRSFHTILGEKVPHLCRQFLCGFACTFEANRTWASPGGGPPSSSLAETPSSNAGSAKNIIRVYNCSNIFAEPVQCFPFLKKAVLVGSEDEEWHCVTKRRLCPRKASHVLHEKRNIFVLPDRPTHSEDKVSFGAVLTKPFAQEVHSG